MHALRTTVLAQLREAPRAVDACTSRPFGAIHAPSPGAPQRCGAFYCARSPPPQPSLTGEGWNEGACASRNPMPAATAGIELHSPSGDHSPPARIAHLFPRIPIAMQVRINGESTHLRSEEHTYELQSLIRTP